MNDLNLAETAALDRPAADFAAGAAYVKGRFVPIGEAAIPITDWGYRRSDVTYDVVGVWGGAFFRLEDHLTRFATSMRRLHLAPRESRDDLRRILVRCVRLLGAREAYVAMDCLRGTPRPGMPRVPWHCDNHIVAFAIPWVWVIPQDVAARGAHLIVARTPRIPDASIDPTVKNFQWGDFTRGLFEARDAGADNVVLADRDGFVTEGAGFNVFMVKDGVLATPDRGSLEGITRASVQELCAELGLRCDVRPITVDELRAADEIFTSTTAGGIAPVSRLDGRPLSGDAPGEISERLRRRFWDKRAAGWHATPVP